MLVFRKFNRISLNNFLKSDILFDCIISSCKSTNNRIHQAIQQNLIKCINVQYKSGTKWIK